MTFSIVARDETGAIGIALASSSPAVAARCIHLRSTVGGVASQNITDPRYGRRLLDAMEAGRSGPEALDALMGSDPTAPFRQVLVVDAQGRIGAFGGERTLGRNRIVESPGFVTGGNLLANTDVPERMAAAYAAESGDLEVRLLAALTAGQAAGGEEGPVHSAGLAVVRDSGWAETDLRVDWDDADPIATLASLLHRWLPERDAYVTRGVHPDQAPSYGVPGDA